MICIIKKLIVCDTNLVSSALYAIPSRNMVSYSQHGASGALYYHKQPLVIRCMVQLTLDKIILATGITLSLGT